MRVNQFVVASALSIFFIAPFALGANVADGLQRDQSQHLFGLGLSKTTDANRTIGMQAPAGYGQFGNVRTTFSPEAALQISKSSVGDNLWNRLPLEKSIKRVQGTGERHIAVFSDPNCSYCHRIEAALATLHNVTVHTFIFPFLSVNSRDKGSDILCATNPSVAWEAWMLQGKAPAKNAACSAATQELLDIGRSFDIRGTPALIFSDGSRVSGFIPADEIEKRLKKTTPVQF